MATRTVGELDPERRRCLLETAAREFATAGYEHASLNRIIAACRMSKSSFYHYFGSKEVLFDTVVHEAAAALRQRIEVPQPANLAGPNFWEAMAGFFTQLLSVATQQAWYADFGKLFYLADTPAASRGALGEVLTPIAAWLEEVLTVGRSCGAIRDDLPPSLQIELAVAILQAMDRWSLAHLDELTPDAQRGVTMAQFAAIRRILAP